MKKQVVLFVFLFLCLSTHAQQTKKNIILILTDDQDIFLGGWRPMQKAQQLIGDTGAKMVNWFVNTPICCPSRSEYLSGRHLHNLRETSFANSTGCEDYTESCACMRVNTSKEFEQNTYANYLQEAGYVTGYFGKYINGGGMTHYCKDNPDSPPPPGWTRFYGMCKIAYYNASWKIDDSVVDTGDAPDDYTTSIIGNQSVAWLNSLPLNKPFHLVVAPHAPHAPYTPAEWYKNVPVPDGAPRYPSFNYSATDHVPFIAYEPPFTDDEAETLDTVFKNRWRALMSVDDVVEALVLTLTKLGRLDDTYIFFTSDHGYHLGEFRLASGKTHFYDFDIRVPMVIFGPGIPANSTYDFIGGNIDLAPTFLDIAGIATPNLMDGKSILPIIDKTNTSAWRDSFLIEFETAPAKFPKKYEPYVTRVNNCPNNTYLALRVMNEELGNIVYAEYTIIQDWQYAEINFYELYDITNDPFQLTNLYNNASEALQQRLHKQLREMWDCSGTLASPSTCL